MGKLGRIRPKNLFYITQMYVTFLDLKKKNTTQCIFFMLFLNLKSIFPMKQVEKLGLREVKRLSLGHKARKRRNQEWGPICPYTSISEP